MSDRPSVAVIGGSIGGLTAALELRDIGCDVTVYERSESDLRARGAGIALLRQTLRYPVEKIGIPIEQISSSTEWVRFLNDDAEVIWEQRHRYRFSSWNTIYRALRKEIGEIQYRLGREMSSLQSEQDGVTVRFKDGEEIRTDLLVCADGINSTARSLLLPDAIPHYAGYVAWRGVVAESQLPQAIRTAFGNALTYQTLTDSHILVYPIPGLDGGVAPGNRLMNMVWYRNVDAATLPFVLTDRYGQTRSASLPPGAARDDTVTEMRDHAVAHLAAPIAELVSRIAEPFVQGVFDVAVPRMAWRRVCLIGDAAFAARPHAGAGAAKAAEDGWALAQELLNHIGPIEHALARWQVKQLALGQHLVARAREIGDSAQFGSGLLPGDARLTFGLYGPGE